MNNLLIKEKYTTNLPEYNASSNRDDPHINTPSQIQGASYRSSYQRGPRTLLHRHTLCRGEQVDGSIITVGNVDPVVQESFRAQYGDLAGNVLHGK